MAGQYHVTVKGAKERWNGYSLRSAKDFARIGSQTGLPRRVYKGRKLIREYRRGKRVWPTQPRQMRGLTKAEIPARAQNTSKGGTSRYIYPGGKKFPVGDAEHERRALAYVKAGRGTPEQIIYVPEWLAKHARDPDVKKAAKAAVSSWKKTGTGLVLKGLKAIKSRARKRNPAGKSIKILAIPPASGKGAWSLEPVGKRDYYAYARMLLLKAALSRPAKGRAKAVARAAERGPVVKMRPGAGLGLEGKKALVLRMPESAYLRLLDKQ